MNDALRDRWFRLAADAGWQGNVAAVWSELLRRYTMPDRAYHNLHHIAACLACFDEAPKATIEAPAVEMAIWFHDVIYDSKAKDNEERSAELFAAEAGLARLSVDIVRQVSALILMTKHQSAPKTEEERLLVDVDLHILGADESAFAEYEKQIREEYAWVSVKDFRTGRAAVLQQFLARAQIYSTPHFFERLESRARNNLRRAIAHWSDFSELSVPQ